ncbi:MAG: GAF domain-containing protein [Nitrospirota bacterium]|nr:GAF domain-containing protein [Nitrospirota bacterium]
MTAPTHPADITRELEHALARHQTRLAELHYALDRISDSVLEMPARLNAVTQVIRVKLGCDACSVYLMDREEDALVLEASTGLAPEAVGHARLKRGEGVTGWVAEHLEAVALADAPSDPRFKYLPETHEEAFRSLLSVPVVADQNFVGVINVQHRQPHPFTEYERLLVGAIGYKVGAMVKSDRLEHEAARHEAAVETLLWVAAHTAAESPQADMVTELVSRARRTLFATGAVLRTLEPDSGRLEVVCADGLEAASAALAPLLPGEGIAGTVLASGAPVRNNHYGTFARQLKAVPAVSASILCIPVRHRDGTVFGTLSFFDKVAPGGTRHFDSADQRLAEGLVRLTSERIAQLVLPRRARAASA